MAFFINETVSSMADFISKLNTFLTTAGAGNADWNADRHVPGSGEFAVSRTGTNVDIQVAFQWDTGTPFRLGIYQYNDPAGAGNYDAGRAGPWDQDGDSGSGFAGTADASLFNERHVPITNTPLQYWAFTSTSPLTYAHMVVQITALEYVSFGFGELDKFNDWDGGAYAYGHRLNFSASNFAVQGGSTHLLDGLCQATSPAMQLLCATILCENLPSQVANGMWAVVMGNQTVLGSDRQSNDGGSSDTARTLFPGGYRANEIAQAFGSIGVSPTAGFVPGYPIPLLYHDLGTDEIYGPMGIMPDVRGINVDQFTPGQEITIGGDTWVAFPSFSIGSGSGKSGNQGMIYKKN